MLVSFLHDAKHLRYFEIACGTEPNMVLRFFFAKRTPYVPGARTPLEELASVMAGSSSS